MIIPLFLLVSFHIVFHSGTSVDYTSGHSGTLMLATTRVDQAALLRDMAAFLPLALRNGPSYVIFDITYASNVRDSIRVHFGVHRSALAAPVDYYAALPTGVCGPTCTRTLGGADVKGINVRKASAQCH